MQTIQVRLMNDHHHAGKFYPLGALAYLPVADAQYLESIGAAVVFEEAEAVVEIPLKDETPVSIKSSKSR